MKLNRRQSGIAAILLAMAAAIGVYWFLCQPPLEPDRTQPAANTLHSAPSGNADTRSATSGGNARSGSASVVPPVSDQHVRTAEEHLPSADGLSPLEIPRHWTLVGPARPSYRFAAVHSPVWQGATSAELSAATHDVNPYVYGALVQSVVSTSFRQRRVTFSAYLRTEDAWAGAGLILHADDPDDFVVAYDGMEHRGLIRGSTEWTRYSVALYVPSTASRIVYGAILNGAGHVWMDAAELDIGDSNAEAVGPGNRRWRIDFSGTRDLLEAPANLDFEETGDFDTPPAGQTEPTVVP